MGNDHAYECQHMHTHTCGSEEKCQVEAVSAAVVAGYGTPVFATQLFCRKNPPRGSMGTGRDSDLGRSLRTTSQWETSGKPTRHQEPPPASWNLSQRSCNAFRMPRSICTVTLLYVPSTPGIS